MHLTGHTQPFQDQRIPGTIIIIAKQGDSTCTHKDIGNEIPT